MGFGLGSGILVKLCGGLLIAKTGGGGTGVWFP